MFYKIVETITNQLNNEVGPNSAYTDNRVEFIDKKIPDDVTVNRHISVVKRNKENGEYNIGQSPAFTFDYYIDVVLLTKHLNYDEGEKSLEKIERRVIKSLSNHMSDVFLVEDTTDNITEQVLRAQLVKVDYDSGLWQDNNWAHIAILNYKITTQFQV